MIDKIIGHAARKQFARAMHFQGGATPALPPPGAAGPCLLYLHVPFCEKLCPYCSFHRVTFDEGLCREYFGALRKELSLYKDRGFTFEGIYAGGGTPTRRRPRPAISRGHRRSSRRPPAHGARRVRAALDRPADCRRPRPWLSSAPWAPSTPH